MRLARVLIVDDEAPARAKLARLCATDPRVELAGEATSGLEALEAIEELAPDVVILDVQMPGMTGFEVLEALGEERELVVLFATAHDEHALRAFDAHAIDYLLKPFDAARFQRALDKALAQLAGRVGTIAPRVAPSGRKRIVVRTAEGWVQLELDEIVRISAADKYICVSTCTGGSYIVRGSLRRFEERVAGSRLLRVHRSEIVHLDAVTRVEPWTHGDAILVLSSGDTIVLSRTYRRAFLDRFEEASS